MSTLHRLLGAPALRQTSIRIKTSLEGVGVHTGEKSRVQIATAPPHTGIRFQIMKDDQMVCEIPANIHHVAHSQFNTTLTCDGHQIHTVEHLLAALMGAGITNAYVRVWGREIPILDGSCRPWLQGVFPDINIRTYAEQQPMIRVLKPVEARQGSSWCRISPSNSFRVSYELAYNHPLIGDQTMSLEITPQTFAFEIAGSRTFGFLKDLPQMQSQGMSLGASTKNVLVFTDVGIYQGQSARWSDEPVRHKILDVVGDLSLASAPILGHFEGHKSGHALNQKLVVHLLADPTAWEWYQNHDQFQNPMVEYSV